MDIINAKAGYIYIIGYIYRPGCSSFACELEHRYYPPDTELNELYNMFMLKYEGMLHMVIEIPAGKTSAEWRRCDQLATELGLKLVPGKPWNGRDEFPVRCLPDACFTLETANHADLAEKDLRQLLQDEVQELKVRYVNNII